MSPCVCIYFLRKTFNDFFPMNPRDMQIEDLIPHRGRMKLIDEILEMDENRAVTRSVVRATWPLFDGESVSPLVLIELVAQTAGVSNAWERIKARGIDSEKMGWLVGIKSSRFFVDAIALDTPIITSSQTEFRYEGFREMRGEARTGYRLLGEVVLQVYQPEQIER
jgi:predicted hotdog family 3-hydroxylacyl-ACP dehydratase